MISVRCRSTDNEVSGTRFSPRLPNLASRPVCPSLPQPHPHIAPGFASKPIAPHRHLRTPHTPAQSQFTPRLLPQLLSNYDYEESYGFLRILQVSLKRVNPIADQALRHMLAERGMSFHELQATLL